MSSLEEAKRALREHATEAHAATCLWFFKTGPGEYGEGDRFLGVRVPQTRKVAKRFRDLPEKEVLTLLTSEFHEERLLALLLLTGRFAKGDADDQARVYELYLNHTRYINGWDLVDTSAPQIVGGYLLNRSRKPLYTLVGSSSLWERRIAIMATFTLIREEQFEDTLNLAERLLQDPEDLLHKAVGWMLREIGNRDRDAEEKFLIQHYRDMPRTMLRYAIEKFPQERRQQFLKGRV